jgi:nitronate monooxygenase
MSTFCELVGIVVPIVQAPMAGVSTPTLAAAVSNAGGLGSIAVGAVDAAATRRMLGEVRALTARPFNLNLFCHRRPRRDAARESRWLEALAPRFQSFGAAPPARLEEVYRTFLGDEEMLALLLDERPPVVRFHFGAPPRATLDALHGAGVRLLASATNLDEARALEDAGIDAIVAQGYEAGGHRGVTDPDAPDPRLGTLALTRLLSARCRVPIVAAGGIMDGAGIAAVLALGASAAQLGTAFIGCPESSADDAYRAALASPASAHTVMTRVVSGRPARCLANRFTELAATVDERDVPEYPLAYAAGKALAGPAARRDMARSGRDRARRSRASCRPRRWSPRSRTSALRPRARRRSRSERGPRRFASRARSRPRSPSRRRGRRAPRARRPRCD